MSDNLWGTCLLVLPAQAGVILVMKYYIIIKISTPRASGGDPHRSSIPRFFKVLPAQAGVILFVMMT